MKKIKEMIMIEIFEKAQAWVDNKLVLKMKAFSQI